ncbi:MAG TPA: hypothetical protein VJY83_10425 [Thiopseudomonas sp.]|nr:hypothetical protein [Thiopseudomonas sp.]
MRADLKDRTLVGRNAQTRRSWLFWLALPASTLALLYVLSNEITHKQPDTVSATVNKSGATRQLLQPANSEQTIQAKPVQTAPEKQTVFNDQNYQPQGSINSIALAPNHDYKQGQARSNAQLQKVQPNVQGVSRTRSIPWSWKSEKTHRRGHFTYKESQNGIDTLSVCRNYTQGSFEYRDCRKAAKQYFKNACSSQYRTACAAGDMIP